MIPKRKEQGTGYRKGTSVSVRPWRNHASYRYRVAFVEGGKYCSKGFWRKKDAEAFAEKKRLELAAYGQEESITHSERSAVLETRARLLAVGVSLRDAIEAELGRLEHVHHSMTVADAVAQFIALKASSNKSERNLSTVRLLLSRFSGDLGSVPVSDITTAHLDDWLMGLRNRKTEKRISPTTWENYRRHLVMFFNQCVTWEYRRDNPAVKTQRPERSESEIGILSPDEATALLAACSPEMLPAIAIGLFAGLRVSEIQRITWNEIDLENGLISLEGAVTKKKTRRVVPIRTNLAVWLESCRGVGPVAPKGHTWRKSFDDVRRCAGFSIRNKGDKEEPPGKPWKTNAMRHSFASYALQADQNAEKVALELGHRQSVRTLYEHYRATCTPKDAERYWDIMPIRTG